MRFRFKTSVHLGFCEFVVTIYYRDLDDLTPPKSLSGWDVLAEQRFNASWEADERAERWKRMNIELERRRA